MRPRTLLIVAALVCGVLVIGMILFNLQAPATGPTQQAARPINIVVAADAIAVGTLIKPQDLTFAPAPADALPAATFDRIWSEKPEDQAASDNKAIAEIVGAVARRRIEAGEPVNRGAVVKPGDSGFLAAVLRPGMRAITVAVTAVTGTGGLIYPGDHVDLILTQNFPPTDQDMTHKSSAETVVENLRVLAIDQQLQVKTPPDGQNQGKIATTVTLEVDPLQAQKVALTTGLGQLSLTIRSLESPDQTVAGGTPPAGGASAGGAPTTAQTAQAPVWAEDVSPALKIQAEAHKKDDKTAVAAKPPVMVIRGDKADEVGVH